MYADKDIMKKLPRETILFDFGWRFQRGTTHNGKSVALPDHEWGRIDLPHDWSIEDLPVPQRLTKGRVISGPFDSAAPGGNSTGFAAGGTAWYRKHFSVPKAWKKKRLLLTFDGVYMDADVWLNGVHLGNHPYGYTAFNFDITDHVKPGSREDNVVAVHVKNTGRNSRWYSGSGIYRHVWLTVTNPIHVAHQGVFVTTPVVTAEEARVRIETTVENTSSSNETVRLETRILSPNGSCAAEHQTEFVCDTQNPYRSVEILNVNHPERWSADSPNLYRVVSTLKMGDRILDQTETIFGIRSLAFSAEKGFLLNGIPTLLKGGCMHHDNGLLGAAAFDRAEERRVAIMKANGFNAVRCAHNPPSTAFLDACDRLGMLVIDESFDQWNVCKRKDDYHRYFTEWWRRDTESMVVRDRNHPSIIMWSIGNEIIERESAQGARCARMQADYVRSLDPTRPVTSALNNINNGMDPYCSALDVVGYNYGYLRYHPDHQRLDQRIMCGTESYPKTALKCWKLVEQCPWVIGDFVWTGYDYLGEASIGWLGFGDYNYWPWTAAWCGDIDICGFKRPQSYYRDLVWKNGRELALFVQAPKPTLHPPVPLNKDWWDNWSWPDEHASWNWPGYEWQELTVRVYSIFDTVTLKFNGNNLRTRRITPEDDFIAEFSVPYQPGELTAVAWQGKSKMAEESLVTTGSPARIRLKTDRKELSADGQDLAFVTIEIVDAQGRRVPDAQSHVHVSVAGAGSLAALGSAKPDSVESFKGPERTMFHGHGLAVIRAARKSGRITLTVAAEGLKTAKLQLRSRTGQPGEKK